MKPAAERAKRHREKAYRRANGLFNCLPFKFKRGRVKFPGFERGKYYLWTANQKVGKSKLVDDQFIHYPHELRTKHSRDIRTRVLYFSLEETEDMKGDQMDCYTLWSQHHIRVSPKELNSISCECPDNILKLTESEESTTFTDSMLQNVEYVGDIKNPTGIYKKVKEWLAEFGTFNYTKGKKQDAFGNWVEAEVVDKNNPYTQNDPEEFIIVIIDNFANLNTERGWDLRETINKMSKYCMELAQYGIIVNGVQHQAQSQESLENLKYSQVVPTINGLGDAKTTARDAFAVFGLFSPMRFLIQNHLKYDVTVFKEYLRFLYIVTDRDGAMGTVIPLLFRGDVSTFEELPKPERLDLLEAIKRDLDLEEITFEETFKIEENNESY